jgi:glycosyltransferase involved in cell wall biosynthesis
MPVYNCERYLCGAVESILSQTYSDFELLIINDGSTDRTREQLESYHDPRIRIIHQGNKGVAAALRLGVELAKGEYLARMDADDESLPDRLEIQKKALDQNSEVALCYGLHDLMDEQGHFLRTCQKDGFSNVATKWLLIWNNVLTHPTVMIRKKTLQENNLNYRLETNGAEDFDLWNRLSLAGEFLFIPQVFLRYRLHSNSVNRINSGRRQFRGYSIVIRENFQRYGLGISAELAEELVVISGQTQENSLTYPYKYLPDRLLFLLEELSGRFTQLISFQPYELSPIQAEQLVRWSRCLLKSSKKSVFNLLKKAFQIHRKIAINRIFILTLSSLLLPKSILTIINSKRTRPLI